MHHSPNLLHDRGNLLNLRIIQSTGCIGQTGDLVQIVPNGGQLSGKFPVAFRGAWFDGTAGNLLEYNGTLG